MERGAGDVEGTVPGLRTKALRRALRARVDGEVRFDAGSRGAYSTDGSNYRQVPIGVVVPRSVEAGAVAVAVCAEFGAPVLSRGGGTSLGGQCTNTAVVIDWTKYCNRLVSVDAERRTCVVEPGIVLDALNRQLADQELKFGPKPSTHSHCSLGGMIGNNSCGASAQAYGKTVDNVRRLEILTYDGARMWVGPTSDEEYERAVAAGGRRAELYKGARELIDRYRGDVRRGFPKIPRRVSGYNLDSLLPENGFDLARALVGSEGTLVTVLRAELDLVPVPACESMVVLGYPDICAAADEVPRLLELCRPTQLEALDGRIAQLMREEGAYLDSLERLPEGDSWLLVQFSGETVADVDQQGRELLRGLGRDESDPSVVFSDDPQREQQMLKAREAGLGVTARPPDDRETWEGWEDSAVPPERLGDYLRDLKELFGEFGYDHPSLYGHFGQGCVHTRIPFDLKSAGGVADFRRFLLRAAELVVSYGGATPPPAGAPRRPAAGRRPSRGSSGCPDRTAPSSPRRRPPDAPRTSSATVRRAPARRRARRRAPAPADRPSNLWEPADGKDGHDYGAHGIFDEHSAARSPLTTLARHPAPVAGGLLGAALGAAVLTRTALRRRGGR